MTTQQDTSSGHGTRTPADTAYRRAWWSLALYPVTFVLAFVIGEGLLTLFTGDDRDPRWWEAVLSATPAILVFVVPGVLAVVFGLRARRLGRSEGAVPAMIGGLVAVVFVGLNLVSGIAVLIFG